MAKIKVTPEIFLDETELSFSFARASGPGGQNVNKVETAVEIRFDVARSPSLPDEVKQRLARAAGARLTKDGVLVLSARTFRTQESNRRAALERLMRLIANAADAPKPRIRTRPSFSARRERLEAKAKRGETKRLRSGPLE